MNHFSTSLLTANELHIAALRLDSILTGNLSKEPFVLKVEPLIKAAAARLEKALSRVSDPSQVKLLAAKDKVRDQRFVSLRDYCKALSTDSDPQLANAGLLLLHIFKKLGYTMYDEGYAVESSLLESLFLKLEDKESSDALTLIGGTTRLDALKVAQSDFELAFNQKVSAITQVDYPTIRESRIAIVRYLSAVIGYIDIMAEVDKGDFVSVNEKIDEVITEFEALGKMHKTRADNEKKEDTEEGKE